MRKTGAAITKTMAAVENAFHRDDSTERAITANMSINRLFTRQNARTRPITANILQNIAYDIKSIIMFWCLPKICYISIVFLSRGHVYTLIPICVQRKYILTRLPQTSDSKWSRDAKHLLISHVTFATDTKGVLPSAKERYWSSMTINVYFKQDNYFQ